MSYLLYPPLYHHPPVQSSFCKLAGGRRDYFNQYKSIDVFFILTSMAFLFMASSLACCDAVSGRNILWVEIGKSKSEGVGFL